MRVLQTVLVLLSVPFVCSVAARGGKKQRSPSFVYFDRNGHNPRATRELASFVRGSRARWLKRVAERKGSAHSAGEGLATSPASGARPRLVAQPVISLALLCLGASSLSHAAELCPGCGAVFQFSYSS